MSTAFKVAAVVAVFTMSTPVHAASYEVFECTRANLGKVQIAHFDGKAVEVAEEVCRPVVLMDAARAYLKHLQAQGDLEFGVYNATRPIVFIKRR